MTTREQFLTACGGVFEHSPWIAEQAWDSGRIGDPLEIEGVHAAMCEKFRDASADQRLAVLRAHPDLAGKLAIAGELTQDSRNEQAGAGLDRLTPDEHAEFTRLNTEYTGKFGFPFIIAVKGLDKTDILDAFRRRIHNSSEAEFRTACEQVEKIARLRLQTIITE